MSTQQDTSAQLISFEQRVDAAFASIKGSIGSVSSSVSNIEADQRGLLQMIVDLRDKKTSTLSQQDQELLERIATKAEGIVADIATASELAKKVADAVPDSAPTGGSGAGETGAGNETTETTETTSVGPGQEGGTPGGTDQVINDTGGRPGETTGTTAPQSGMQPSGANRPPNAPNR